MWVGMYFLCRISGISQDYEIKQITCVTTTTNVIEYCELSRRIYTLRTHTDNNFQLFVFRSLDRDILSQVSFRTQTLKNFFN